MKKIILTLILVINLLVPTHATAQYGSKLEAGLSNVALGGLVGGVGAVINKKKNAKFGKTFWKGFYKGAIGGYLIYEGKNLMHKASLNVNSNYYWPSKLVHTTGASILENAAANRGMLEQIHINFGFNRIDCYTKKNFKLRYRVLPINLVVFTQSLFKYDFSFNNSIKTGSMFFYARNEQQLRGLSGIAIYNSIVLAKYLKPINSPGANLLYLSKFKTISHEAIHVYQYESTFALNMFLNKPLNKLNKIKVINWYQKYFYTEYNTSLFIFYDPRNRTNFIEKEADFYSINR